MIKRKAFTPIMIVIIILAILGLVGTILSNPKQSIQGLFLFSSAILTGIVVVFLVRYRRRTKNDELRKYRKAAKQSLRQQRSKNQHQLIKSRHKKVTSISSKRKADPPHLRVIDGKKTSKNDPMFL